MVLVPRSGYGSRLMEALGEHGTAVAELGALKQGERDAEIALLRNLYL
jgi:hypothetical protein